MSWTHLLVVGRTPNIAESRSGFPISFKSAFVSEMGRHLSISNIWSWLTSNTGASARLTLSDFFRNFTFVTGVNSCKYSRGYDKTPASSGFRAKSISLREWFRLSALKIIAHALNNSLVPCGLARARTTERRTRRTANEVIWGLVTASETRVSHLSSLKPVHNESKTVRCDPEVRGTKLEFTVEAIFFLCHVDSLSTIVSRFTGAIIWFSLLF